MKLFRKLVCVAATLMLTTVAVSAASGSAWYRGGTIKFTWYTSWNFRGDFINGTAAGYGWRKQVVVRMGESATVSGWAARDTLSISARDYGPFGSIGAGNYSAYANTE